MKYISVLAMTGLMAAMAGVMSGCGCGHTQIVQSRRMTMTDAEQGALNTVRKYLAGYAQGNIDDCMSVIATTKPILLFGTNDDEVMKTTDDVRAALRKDRAHMSAIRLGEFRHTHVTALPEQAFVLVEVPMFYQADGKEVTTLLRMALSLNREDGEWKICSGMASAPFASGTYSFN